MMMQLPPSILLMLRSPLLAHAARYEPDFIVGGAESPYLRRWHMAPRADGPGCYLHQFLRSDDDRALHDHPYASTSILLRGDYIEHTPDGRFLRQEGIVLHRPDAAAPHRIQLLEQCGQPLPVWTLFLTGPRMRDWGFHCPQGWRPWQEFVDVRDSGAVGRGCA